MRMGLIRNHYVGRTFIEPQQSIRHFGVRVKLNPVRSILEGKRVVLVDDSIVRGTTSRKIVRMVRSAGAREVHMRISCPPTISPCFYGVDTPRRSELIAATHTLEEIRKYLDADSVAYLSLDGLTGAVHRRQVEVLHVVLHRRLSGGVSARRGGVPAAGAEAESGAGAAVDPQPVADGRLSTPTRLPARRPSSCRGAETSRVDRSDYRVMDYKASGVDIDAGNETVRRIRGLARSTFTPAVLSDIGSFGGLFRLEPGPLPRAGAGVERRRRRHQAEGRVPGRPARHRRASTWSTTASTTSWCRAPSRCSSSTTSPPAGCRPTVAEAIVGGMAAACRENGCALLGGETAEMPGFYADGEYDLAGFIVGVVDASG